MEASKEKNGNRHLDTLETGRTTVKMALAFSSTKTETSMRACGRETEDMAKELTGETKQAS